MDNYGNHKMLAQDQKICIIIIWESHKTFDWFPKGIKLYFLVSGDTLKQTYTYILLPWGRSQSHSCPSAEPPFWDHLSYKR